MKKTFLISLILISIAAGAVWYKQSPEAKQHIGQWFENTRELLSTATSGFSRPSSEQTPNIAPSPTLDDKLEALLPQETTQSINWHYTAIENTVDDVTVDNSDPDLLPNLFKPSSQAEITTGISGQLHLDEADNIIGAEVLVEIPTNM